MCTILRSTTYTKKHIQYNSDHFKSNIKINTKATLTKLKKKKKEKRTSKVEFNWALMAC